jgi:hypothetical protein
MGIQRVERWSGAPEDGDEFRLRFKCAAGDRGYTDIFRGTYTRYKDSDIALFTDTEPAGLTGNAAAKKELARKHNKEFDVKDGAAYRFIISSLDAASALQLARDVADEDAAGDPVLAVARPAYLRFIKFFNDGSAVTLSRMLLELVRLRCGDEEDPIKAVRKQQALFLKLRAGGVTVPDLLLNVLMLEGLPSQHSHLHSKFIDATDSSGNPLTYDALRERLETNFAAAKPEQAPVDQTMLLQEQQRTADQAQRKLEDTIAAVMDARDRPGDRPGDFGRRQCSECVKYGVHFKIERI